MPSQSKVTMGLVNCLKRRFGLVKISPFCDVVAANCSMAELQ